MPRPASQLMTQHDYSTPGEAPSGRAVRGAFNFRRIRRMGNSAVFVGLIPFFSQVFKLNDFNREDPVHCPWAQRLKAVIRREIT